MYRSSPFRGTLNTGYNSNNSDGLKGGLEASLTGRLPKGGLKRGYLKVTIRGGGFRVTLRRDLSSRYLQAGLQGGYLKGGFQALSKYLQGGLTGGYLKATLRGNLRRGTLRSP